MCGVCGVCVCERERERVCVCVQESVRGCGGGGSVCDEGKGRTGMKGGGCERGGREGDAAMRTWKRAIAAAACTQDRGRRTRGFGAHVAQECEETK